MHGEDEDQVSAGGLSHQAWLPSSDWPGTSRVTALTLHAGVTVMFTEEDGQQGREPDMVASSNSGGPQMDGVTRVTGRD